MDADSVIKLASVSAKEQYLSGLTAYMAPAAATEASRGPSSGPTADSLLIKRNIELGRIRLAGSGKGRSTPPVRAGEDGDSATLSWAHSPGIDLVVSDDRHLLVRLGAVTESAMGLTGSIPFLVSAGVLTKASGLEMLSKLSGRVGERARVEAIRTLEAMP